MKYTRRIVSILLIALMLCSMLSINALAADPGGKKLGIAYVDASSLRLRAAPNTKSTTLDYASRDEVVVLLEKSGSWYKVMYDLQIGYMHKDYLDVSTVENVELGYGVVNASSVNMRSGPGTSYKSLGKSKSGDLAYIIGINNQWFKVIHGNNIGYIRNGCQFFEQSQLLWLCCPRSQRTGRSHCGNRKDLPGCALHLGR